MHPLSELLVGISVPTQTLKLESIQKILSKAKENNKFENNEGFWNEVAKILWSHLNRNLKNMDHQLLCATCFFTVLTCVNKTDSYINDLLKTIDEEKILKMRNKSTSKTLQVVSLMYGLFQSSFLTQNTSTDIQIDSILKSTIDLHIIMGYEYSQYTYIIFKTIKLYRKVYGTHLQEHIFNTENIVKLLNLVNHNWENPVTGVRDLNRNIFQTLIILMNEDMYKNILNQIDNFYWNKAKYLMLSEIIECTTVDIIVKVQGKTWIEGLINSLYKPGLVSAGADMYYALLKKINNIDDWCELFLHRISNIFNGSNNKAIENFNNYWCVTTLKKFPTLTDIFIEQLKNNNVTQQKIYSSLCILKQANKLGIIDKHWNSKETEEIVLCGIEHCNNYIRMLAFEVVCVSQGKTFPTSAEYELILSFLYNNVNSDCTVLRLSMLSSMNSLLTQLHSVFLNNMIKNSSNTDIEKLLDFSKNLQNIIKECLSLNVNYQRKITSIKLCDMLISSFGEVPKKKKGQSRQVDVTLLTYIKDKGSLILTDEYFIIKLITLLKDPADDVREGVIKLLLNHFCSELNNMFLDKIIDDGLKCMKGKFFYEIGCGQSIFKLIANLVMRKKHFKARFTNIEDIFYYAYNELCVEYKINRDIVKSIETGKQLHSFICILLIVLDVCHVNSYKIDITGVMDELLNILEGIANQFNWEEGNATSSDFSKMNYMVHNIIANSGYEPCDGADQTKISGLQQIVLNSLWLNVKASCDLASLLIKYNLNNVDMAKKCLIIITHVLETSRHKGAIEAAGVALGRAIQCLTSLSEENEASNLPYEFLKCKLQDLISETNNMSSVTRRGAGLSIMVHRIVSSDMQRGKPLFHYFMSTLLEICNKIDFVIDNAIHTNTENEVDMPKAIYIHFMTRIVVDSSLASDLMYYSAQLAELAFGNLTSPQWQIRNAALQLYGALIPRLIGQKKSLGSDDETVATVAYDELRTHSPKLWKYVTEKLNEKIVVDKIQYHSNLVPILNMLASCAKRYNFELDEQGSSVDELLECLFGLLDSPIHTLRRLAAKSIYNIYNFDIIYHTLCNKEYLSENFLHGSLILVGLVQKYYSSQIYEEKFNDLRTKYANELENKNHSYLCKEHFESMYLIEFKVKSIHETFAEMNKNKHMPGVYVWAETRIKKNINCSTWCEIPDILNIILKESDYEKYSQLILLRLKVDNNAPKDVYLEIIDILLKYENKYCSSIIWEIVYEISKKIDLNDRIDILILLERLQDKKATYKLRYMIPLIARNIVITSDETKFNIVKLITDISNFENSDVEMRYISSLANNEIAYQFQCISDKLKITSIKCAVMLLQDEDEDVRNLSVNFYKILSEANSEAHAYICLNKILNVTFLNKVFCDPKKSIEELCRNLNSILIKNHTVDEYNPFTNESKNIYLEMEVLKVLIANIVCGYTMT